MPLSRQWMQWVLHAALLAVVSTTASVRASEQFEGDGTVYTLNPPSSGNCNFMYYPNDAVEKYAAINNEQWNDMKNCGRCAQVSCADPSCSGNGQSEVVHIVDRCPECKKGDLDLSPSVFKHITGSSPSRLRIKWKFVDCPVQGNVKFCLKGGSNNFWTAIQPANLATGVRSMQINGQSTGMVASAYYYLLDGKSTSQTDLSHVKISLTSVSGEVLEETVALTAGSCTDGTRQFSRGKSPIAPSADDGDQKEPSAPPAPTSAPPTVASSPTPSARADGSNTKDGDERNATIASLQPKANKTEASTAMPSLSGDLETAESDRGDLRLSPTSSSGSSQTSTAPRTIKPPPKDNNDAKETTTQSAEKGKGTSPMLIILAICAAVGTIALVVMAAMVKKKKLEDKQNDQRDDAHMVHSTTSSVNAMEGALTRTFDPIATPFDHTDTTKRMDFATL